MAPVQDGPIRILEFVCFVYLSKITSCVANGPPGCVGGPPSCLKAGDLIFPLYGVLGNGPPNGPPGLLPMAAEKWPTRLAKKWPTRSAPNGPPGMAHQLVAAVHWLLLTLGLCNDGVVDNTATQ